MKERELPLDELHGKGIPALFQRLTGETWLNLVLPLCLCLGTLVNFGAYYLGLAFEDNIARNSAFVAVQLAFAALCALTLLAVLRTARLSKVTWCLLWASVLFYLLSLGFGLVKYRGSSVVLNYLIQFLCFALPAFFAGGIAALRRTDRMLVPMLEKLSFFVFPASLAYLLGAVFACNPFNYGKNLGIVGYMTFAYGIMPFLLAHMLAFVERQPFTMPVLNRAFRRPQLARGCMLGVYWAAIVASGTRGTYVCVLLFCVLLPLACLLRRKGAKRAAVLSGLMAGFLIFNFVVAPLPGMSRVGGLALFVDGLSEGKIVTAKEDPSVAEKIDELVGSEDGKQVANLPGETTPPGELPEEPDPDAQPVQIGSRGTLYQLALKEFLKAPGTGMGAGGYTIKYGMYPHSILLEALCETGLAGFLPLMGLVLLAVIKLLRRTGKDPAICAVTLFLFTFAMKACISGCLWTFPALPLALGYAFALPAATADDCGEDAPGEEMPL